MLIRKNTYIEVFSLLGRKKEVRDNGIRGWNGGLEDNRSILTGDSGGVHHAGRRTARTATKRA